MVDLVGLVALLLVAFAGGAFGAALGALPAFTFAGFVVVVGEVANITGRSVAAGAGGDAAALGATGITASIGLGPGFGPHIVFGGGAAAAAFAARKGYLDHEFDYHHAKDVTYSLGPRVDLLLVGGAFGVLGLLLTGLSAGSFGSVGGSLPWPGLPWDPIAMSIVLSAFLHRLAFGYPLIGNVRGNILDMSPFDRGERRGPTQTGAVRTDGSGIDPKGDTGTQGRYLVEPWLPHQREWASVALLGAVVGIFGAFVTYSTGSPFLAFGITVSTLVFINLGMEEFPVTHHMALPSSILVVGLAGGATTAAGMSAAISPAVAVVAGAVMGVFAGLVGELSQRVLYAHADTHLDPPAAAIVVSTFVVALLDMAGVITQNAIPTPF